MKNKINLFEPKIDKSEEKIVLDILRSKFWASGSGVENVKKFETKFKKYIQSDQCLAVNSGTAALNIALSLINIKNKEVILPSLSFVSTANCILMNGGIPVFADVDPETLCLGVDSIKKSITKNYGSGLLIRIKYIRALDIFYICTQLFFVDLKFPMFLYQIHKPN